MVWVPQALATIGNWQHMREKPAKYAQQAETLRSTDDMWIFDVAKPCVGSNLEPVTVSNDIYF